MNFRYVLITVVLSLLVVAIQGKKRGHGGRSKEHGGGRSKERTDLSSSHILQSIESNLTALWEHIHEMETRGVHLHVNGPGVCAGEAEDHADDHDHDDDDHDHDHDHSTHIYMHMQQSSDFEKIVMKKMMALHPDGYIYAQCNVHPNSAAEGHDQSSITGVINMKHKFTEGPVEIDVDLSGFDTSADHDGHTIALHVHQFGDDSNGCESMGDHFTLHRIMPHGNEDEHSISGHWGTLSYDDGGMVHMSLEDPHTSLMGPHSILGRSIVIGEIDEDDNPDHHITHRLACCVIAQTRENQGQTSG